MMLSLGKNRRTVRAVPLLLAVAGTFGLSSCAVFSPPTVLKPYDPSDGLQGNLGDVDVRNALIVSSGVDQPGVVSVTLVNTGEEAATVTVASDVASGSAPSAQFDVPAGGVLRVGDPEAATSTATEGSTEAAATEAAAGQTLPGWLQLPQVPDVPGQTTPLTFSAGGDEITLAVPIVLPCFEYSELLPTAAPGATAAPTASATCGPQEGDLLGGEH
ncbi:hypothetical protein ACFFKU_16160 [Kineococcus gynurae]|uniref:Copper(I)-binding protein n=1 Tax=Kineococcus gynurae TaxID=452979 RepID=A0ABV5LPQ3_9ACTN